MKQMQLLLMHIPKTGGTTIEQVLGQWLNPTAVATHVESMDRNARDALGSKRFVSGHLDYHEIRRLPYWSTFKRAVILREPYARLASAIRMTARFGHPANGAQLRTLPESARRAAIKLGRMDIEDPEHLAWFFEHEKSWVNQAFVDTQVRYLADEAMGFDVARRNLDSFDYVEFTERLDAFVADLGVRFDRPEIPEAVRFNAADSVGWVEAPPLDYTNVLIRAVLTPLIQGDLELYAYAVNLAAQRKSNLGASAKKESAS